MTNASAQPSLLRSAPRMDRRGDKKRAREGEEQVTPAAAGKKTKKGLQAAEDAAVAALFEDAAAAAAAAVTPADAGGGEGAWQRPAWVFDLPWLKTRGGLGLSFAAAPGGWEHRDVFFRSLVDGAVATIGVPGDRFSSPPFKLAKLFGEVEAWLATAGVGEVNPVWRSVLEGPSKKPKRA